MQLWKPKLSNQLLQLEETGRGQGLPLPSGRGKGPYQGFHMFMDKIGYLAVRHNGSRACASRLLLGGCRLGLRGLIHKIHQASEVDARVVAQAHLASAAGGVAVRAAAHIQVLQRTNENFKF